jgi:hypothetical protein
MSGGSYNYLHVRAPDEIRGLKREIAAMAEALSAYSAVAARTKAIAEALERAAAEADALADVWHAQEWVESGDWSPASVRAAAIEAGEVLPPCEHKEVRQVFGLRDGRPGTLVRFRLCEDCGEDFDP